ncbi:MAG: hypothetical protein ACRDPC_28685 [Solirubrobacteraceae bacterium]
MTPTVLRARECTARIALPSQFSSEAGEGERERVGEPEAVRVAAGHGTVVTAALPLGVA